MHNVCNDIGLQQKVTKPKKEDHLLDVLLTNVPRVKTTILPSISDHKFVVADMQFKIAKQVVICQTIRVCANAG